MKRRKQSKNAPKPDRFRGVFRLLYWVNGGETIGLELNAYFENLEPDNTGRHRNVHLFAFAFP